MTSIVEVVLTGPPAAVVAIVRILLNQRLIASAQIADVRSSYWWSGSIESAKEARATMRTRTEVVPELLEVANREHPYEVPGIIVLPVIDGNVDYLQWVRNETSPSVT
ncbi:divalent-cation tolerance protein CutA [Tenggerimyces flavus]|uniref:Divalent-cation tolerance protein CutA n=1 Tax=Tenggerimyces flavus TaxID=1708749 RepID=A0ABV7Y532_9ACTN|nr:divalent-cation tolerance protein CutA [Tenggerimyces flavus]MBM7788232.1 periplasmic divalent cation tolerance protein [Tenggerimyces flavus]